MLGILLPKLNIWMTRGKHKQEPEKNAEINNNNKNASVNFQSSYISMDKFTNKNKK